MNYSSQIKKGYFSFSRILYLFATFLTSNGVPRFFPGFYRTTLNASVLLQAGSRVISFRLSGNNIQINTLDKRKHYHSSSSPMMKRRRKRGRRGTPSSTISSKPSLGRILRSTPSNLKTSSLKSSKMVSYCSCCNAF